MRRWIFNFHLYTALVVGLFVVILGVTGSIIAFEEDLDVAFNPKLMHVTPSGTDKITPSAAIAAFQALYPGAKVTQLWFGRRPDRAYSTRVGTTESFLNPYTGAVIGTRDSATGLRAIHSLHVALLMGRGGKTVVMIISAVLVWLVGSGIYLWWPRKRATIDFSASTRRIAFDWHNAVGIFSAGFLLLAGASGIVIHFDDSLATWLNRSAKADEPVRMLPSAPHAAAARRITADRAVEAALAALPGTTANALAAPTNDTLSYYVSLRFPEDLTPGGRSWAIIDQFSGKPLFVENSRAAPLGTRVFAIQNRAIHTGDILGYPTKILMSLACLMLIGQAITGYYLWWKKRRAVAGRTEKRTTNNLAGRRS
jgi:uncharacterized iron-regulated membrane protein